jgi:hypothetical protein
VTRRRSWRRLLTLLVAALAVVRVTAAVLAVGDTSHKAISSNAAASPTGGATLDVRTDVVVSDRRAISASIFSRVVAGRTLSFRLHGRRLVDLQTGTRCR